MSGATWDAKRVVKAVLAVVGVVVVLVLLNDRADQKRDEVERRAEREAKASARASAKASASAAPSGSPTVSPGGGARPDLALGEALLEAGDLRLELWVNECLVGADQTGSPAREVAVSAGTSKQFLSSEVVVNVDVLVPQSTGGSDDGSLAQEHRLQVTHTDGQPDLAASDGGGLAYGGEAPDDFVTVTDDGWVLAEGFRLRETGDPTAEPSPAGTFAARCPSGAP